MNFWVPDILLEQDCLHNLHGPLQDENAKPLIMKAGEKSAVKVAEMFVPFFHDLSQLDVVLFICYLTPS